MHAGLCHGTLQIQIPDIQGKDTLNLAGELADAMQEDYGTRKKCLTLARRDPKARQELWARIGVTPRGIDRETSEMMHRTHMGVDNVRILVLASALADALGTDISSLPMAGAAPEWYSEKAVSIGVYVVASGIFTVLGPMPPVTGSMNTVKLLTEGLEDVVGATFAVEPDPEKAATLISRHIEKKRAGLGLSSSK